MNRKQSEVNEYVEKLRETLKPGDTVYCVLRNVSRSGMMRYIDLYLMEDNQPRRITYWAAKVGAGSGYDTKHEALKMSGCGMDMGFSAVYNLSRILFHGFKCIGKGCSANDHNNAYNTSRQGRCIVCNAEVPESSKWTRLNGEYHRYKVCSEACATGEWIHRDGGYALNYRWM